MELEQLKTIEVARAFLSIPFNNHYQFRELSFRPNISLLQWLPSLPDEVLLYLWQQQWIITRCTELGLPSYFIPKDADAIIHSHFHQENDDGSTPSPNDFFNCSPKALNFIASKGGFTQYWSLDNPEHQRVLEAEVNRPYTRFGPGSEERYLKFLSEIEAKYKIFPWQNLTDEELSHLITPKH